MCRECVFENTGIGFSILEILQEPECREDQLEQYVRFKKPWNFLTVNLNLHFWRLTMK